MKLSGHSYDNDVFNSLIKNLGDNIKTAQVEIPKQETPKVDFNFTSTTESDFNNILEDELKFIAQELLFAAKQANVTLEGEHLSKFASQVKQEGLRGKQLERAARRFCNEIFRTNAAPIGTTRLNSDELINHARANTVLPAGYPSEQVNNSATGKYMGCSKNPNSIWDTDALTRFAQIPNDHQNKFGDEQIKESKEAQEKFAHSQKQQMWQEHQDNMSDENMVRKGISNVSTIEKAAFNPKMPQNTMSIFNKDRDFSNIPDKTSGEILKEQAENRANKKSQEDKVVKIASCQKTSPMKFVFEEDQGPPQKSGLQQKSIDKIFDALKKD